MEEKNSEKKERKMRDSGIPWIGEVPEGWGVNKIKYHLTRNEIKNKPDKQVLSVYRDYGVIPKDSRDDNHNVTSEDTSKYKYVQKGDLVINKMKAWQGSLGVSKYEGIVSPAYYIYKFHDDSFDGKFFHYLIRGCYKDEFRRISGGIREGQWDLSAEKFENTMIIIPPIPEQHRIADFLDSKCSEIDTLIENLRVRVESAKEYKKAVITEAVTKGLDKDAKMKDSGVEWIGEIPEHWEMRRIKNIGVYRNGLTYSPSDMVDENDGKLVLRSSNIQNGKLSFDNNVYVKTKIPKLLQIKRNDILICSRNGSKELVGKSALINEDIDATFGAFMMILRCECAKYMYYILNSSLLSFYIGSFATSTINQLTGGNFGNMKFPFTADTKEQQYIADYLDSKCSEIDTILQNYETQIATLEEYKKSLIYEYVTGKKEVPAA